MWHMWMWKAMSLLVQVSLAAVGPNLATQLPERRSPQMVSPGDSASFEEVADPCPTFSWVSGSKGPEELLVYRAGEHGEWQAEPTIRLPLPAGAASWTPSAASCLSAGLYAWSIRPLGAAAAASDSPEVLLFRVPEPLDERELRRALAVVQRWLAEHPHLDAGPLTAPPIDEPPSARVAEALAEPDAGEVDRAARLATPTGVGGGNLKVTGDYLYDSPRTFGLYLGPDQFVSSDPNFRHSVDFAYDSTGAGWEAYAHPRFPHGAHVTELLCYYFDGGPGAVDHFGFQFYKRAPNVSSSTLITYEPANPRNDEANTFHTSVIVPNFDEHVWHSANVYYRLTVIFESSAGSTNPSFHGCRFVYTLDRASS